MRHGSIIPLGPVMLFTSEKTDAEWEIRVYPGAGVYYIYDNGESSCFDIIWNYNYYSLTLSDRKGGYSGMTVSRKLKLVKVDRKSGIDVTEIIN